MVKIKVIHFRTCDNCGSATQDKDEILCRTCKPSLAIKAEIRELREQIDYAYWLFTRTKNTPPPIMQVPEAYARLAELGFYDNTYKRE